MKPRLNVILPLLAAVATALLPACASIGRPEGGPRDETPPVFVRSDPAPGTLNFSGNRLNIFFDENIKLEDAMNKVVVSPVQQQPPSVSGNGHRVTVTFRDTLVPDATYTVDFSDAIRDLNEGNILDGFAFDFATGPTRDSLVISGMLFEARNLEPAQGMIVGVYSDLSDTAITTLPFERIAKTNQYGQFVIRNLAPKPYRLFAVNDLNRDYHWDVSEDVAFFGDTIMPAMENIMVTDTLRAVNGADSVVTRPGIRYLPNDLLLTWFNENRKPQYLKTYNRIDSTRVFIELGAPSDTFPELTLLNTPSAGRHIADISRLEHSSARDSLTYWLTDRGVISSDTLLIEARYLKTDSLNELSLTVDTLKFINKNKPKPDKKKADKSADKAAADSAATDSVPIKIELLKFTPATKSTQDIHLPIHFTAPEPLDSIAPEAVRLYMQRDTLWDDLGPQTLALDSVNRPMRYTLRHQWVPGAKYRLTVDSASVYGIYGLHNGPVKQEFTVKTEDEYSTITFNVSGAPAGAKLIVELLNGSDKPLSVKPVDNGSVTFPYLSAANYYARLFIDANDNGVWDTGNVGDQLQPEEVYYYPKKINLKKNWEVNQSWNIIELPIDRQKPSDIKKNKPKTKANDRDNQNRRDRDEEEEADEGYNPGFRSSGQGGPSQSQRGNSSANGLRSSNGSQRR